MEVQSSYSLSHGGVTLSLFAGSGKNGQDCLLLEASWLATYDWAQAARDAAIRVATIRPRSPRQPSGCRP